MNLRVPPATAITLGLAALVPLTGCEDEIARARADARAVIDEARLALQKTSSVAVTAADEDYEQVRSSLESIVRDVEGVRQAAPGQIAAARMLAATAHGELAALNLQQVERLETDATGRRAVVTQHLDAIASLHVLIRSTADRSVAEQRRALNDARREAQQLIQQHSQQMATLDEPISERRQANVRDEQEITKLRGRVNELIRQHRETRSMEGLEIYKQAVDLRRQAELIQADVARKQLDLEYELEPEHEFAQTRIEQLQSLIATIDGALAELDALQTQRQNAAGAARNEVDAYAQEVRQTLEQLEEDMSGPLAQAYEEGLEHARQAAEKAERAAGGARAEAATAANVAAARAQVLVGRFNAARAAALADHEALLRKAEGLGDVVGSSRQLQEAIQAASSRRNDATDAARAAFEQALEAAGSARGRGGADLVTMQTSIQAAISALAMPSAGPTPTSMPTPLANGGYESPEAIVQVLQAAAGPDGAAQLDAISGAMVADTSAGRELLSTMRSFVQAITRLQRATEAQFPGAADAMGTGMSGTPAAAGPRIVERGDGKAVVETAGGFGAMNQVTLVQRDGAWFISLDDVPQSSSQQLAMFNGMIAAFNDIAAKIEAGEFATAEQAQQALMGAMFGQMGGGAGAGQP